MHYKCTTWSLSPFLALSNTHNLTYSPITHSLIHSLTHHSLTHPLTGETRPYSHCRLYWDLVHLKVFQKLKNSFYCNYYLLSTETPHTHLHGYHQRVAQYVPLLSATPFLAVHAGNGRTISLLVYMETPVVGELTRRVVTMATTVGKTVFLRLTGEKGVFGDSVCCI